MDRGLIAVIFGMLAIVCGQVMLKKLALVYNKTETLFNLQVLALLSGAGTLYVLSGVLWVWALRTIPLSKAYPVFALAFVLVPLISIFAFNETVNMRYWIGVALIVSGVVISAS